MASSSRAALELNVCRRVTATGGHGHVHNLNSLPAHPRRHLLGQAHGSPMHASRCDAVGTDLTPPVIARLATPHRLVSSAPSKAHVVSRRLDGVQVTSQVSVRRQRTPCMSIYVRWPCGGDSAMPEASQPLELQSADAFRDSLANLAQSDSQALVPGCRL